MDEEKLKIIQEEAEKFLGYLKIDSSAQVQVDEAGAVQLSLQTEDTGLIIGYHGQTLAALQFIFNLILYKKLGTWVKVIFNVGDWRQRREDYLRKMAQNIAQRVIGTGEEAACPHLTAAERRIIHLALQENGQVITESQGEGEDRRLIVKPKP